MFRLKRNILFILLSYFTINIVFLSPNTVKAQNILFIEDFNDGNADNWTVVSGGSFLSVNQGRYGGIVTTYSTVADSVIGDTTWSNYIYEVDMESKQGADINLLFRYLDSGHRYGFHISSNSIKLEKVHPTTIGNEDVKSEPITFNYNTIYRMRIVLNDSNIKIYQDGNLVLEYTDPDPMLNGKIGIRVGTGGTAPSEVWFDNIVVSEIPQTTPSPTPTIEPSPSPSPIPSPTTEPTIGPFELPFNYDGRPATDSATFKQKFLGGITALFDHEYSSDHFIPYTGIRVIGGTTPQNCNNPFACYSGHNGTDFKKSQTDGMAISVAAGKVVYTSKPTDNCITDTSGYGCSVIVKYAGNLYGLYAHLNSISVSENQLVTNQTIIGEMGQTGSATGDHLHFGVLKPVNDNLTSETAALMKNKDWKNILFQLASDNKPPKYRSYCTYKAPNGISFAFLDPSGWSGTGKDPWSLTRKQGGCGINSPYIWKYSIL